MKLNALYNNPKSKNNTEYFSKLAIIELCGWIEDSFDDLAKQYAKKNLKDAKNIKYFDGRIKKIHGFDYMENIRPLLIMLVGLRKFETIENKLNKNYEMDKLKATLERLAKKRNEAAHSHIYDENNVIRSFDAPSKIYSDWKDVYDILKKIETELKVSR